MSAAGRYLLFEVLNPSDEVRLLLEISMSLKSEDRLPPAAAVGQAVTRSR